jgi:polyisoprenoid-binding protein YceI
MTGIIQASKDDNSAHDQAQRHDRPQRGGTGRRRGKRRGRRHWLIWCGGIVAAIIVIAAGSIAAFVKLGPTARPLTLPVGPQHAPTGTLDGTWKVSHDSEAGFRVRESALGFSNYVGGTTKAVTGTIVISGNSVTAAVLRVNLTTIKVSGKRQPQLAASLGTRDHPIATFRLSGPVPLSPAFVSGATVTISAGGQLTVNGLTHAVTITLTARRDGSELQAAGSIPVAFTPWRITQPAGFGFLGSLANHGAAEFALILHRA